MAIAPVLKTGVRKDFRVRVPGPPCPPDVSRGAKRPLNSAAFGCRDDAKWRTLLYLARTPSAPALRA